MDAIYFVDFKKSSPGGNYFSIKECFLVLLELTDLKFAGSGALDVANAKCH